MSEAAVAPDRAAAASNHRSVELPMAEKKMPGRSATVYGLVSSAEPDRIRYIGCTTQLLAYRLSGHKTNAVRGKNRVNRWVRDCLARGERITAVVLEENATFDDEVTHIARLRAKGADLLNETDGAMGTRGRAITEAHRAAMHLPASDRQKETVRELHRTKRDLMLRGILAASADPVIRAQRSERMKARTPEQMAKAGAKARATLLATRTPAEIAEIKRRQVASYKETVAKRRAAKNLMS